MMSACSGAHTSPSSFSGVWSLTTACRQRLPAESAGAAATLRLERTGRFVADQVPCGLLGGDAATSCGVVSGGGTWRVDDGAGVNVELTFDSLRGSSTTPLPYGTQLHVDGKGSGAILFYFDGDPDVAPRVEFGRQSPL